MFLIDDHALYRTGLREVIETEPGISVVGEAERGSGTLDQVVGSGAQIAMVDLRLPDVSGIEVCHELVAHGNVRCIVLTSFHASEADLVAATEAGASAYLVKGGSITQLLASIKAVAAGTDLLSPTQVHRYP